MAKTTLLIATAITALAATANAQTVNRVVEPVPQADVLATIDAPISYDENGVIKAQHFKAGDLTEAQYQALLAEADRIRAYQSNQGQYTGISYQATTRQDTVETSSVQSVPVQTSYDIELFETTTVSTPTVTHAATTPVPQFTARNTHTHKVIKGDTLYGLSKRYAISIGALQTANSLAGSHISLGQTLTIPGSAKQIVTESTSMAPVTSASTVTLVRNVEPVPGQTGIYAVLPKDTLYSISRRACVSINALIETNGIANPNALKPGQRLIMPSGHCLN